MSEAELPPGWCEAPLGNVVARIEAGSSFACEERPPRSGEVGVLKISAVSWGEYDENESKTCVDLARVNPALFIREGDFLFSRANTIELVGACVIARRVTKNIMLSDKILRLRPREGVDPTWLLHYLRTQEGRRQLENASTGNQLSMRNIPQERLRAIGIPIPPLNEQRRTVAKLEDLLARSRRAKEALDAIPPLLETLRRSILAAAFRGDLTREWRKLNSCEPQTIDNIRRIREHSWNQHHCEKSETRQSRTSRARYEPPSGVGAAEEPHEVPETWAWATLEDVSLNFDGVRVPVREADRSQRRGEFPYYGASGIIDHVDGYLFDGEYLLVAEDGANLLSRSTPIAFEASGRFWVNNHAHVLKAAAMRRSVLCAFLNSLDLQTSVTGSAQPKLTRKNLDRLPVAVPPDAEQLELERVLAEAWARIERIEAVLRTAKETSETLKRSALAKAFRGELVPQDPSDEPADVMLARLRATSDQDARPSGVRAKGRKKKSA